MKKTIIIGAGPAGILAAIASKGSDNEVILIDKNEKIGKKLFITGKGRCNITNFADINTFYSMINNNPKFMYSSFNKFDNIDILKLLESNGLKYKVERGNRVFPSSDKSSDVIKTFSKILKSLDIKIILDENIDYVEKVDNIFKVYSKKNKYEADFLVIATGGVSYPLTGSTGDGYKFAEGFGHRITELKPSLVPLKVKNEFVEELQGTSLKNVEVSLKNNNKLIHKEFGEMLFTHFGLSGPIILKLSNYILKKHKNILVSTDLKPKLDIDTLDRRIQKDFEKFSNKNIENGLNELLIKKLIPVVLSRSNIDGTKKINQITKEERISLINTIKGLEFEFIDFMPLSQAIITKGGISTKDINPKTMESKIVENLYFAGETIDVDAMTGGFNLQVAYSTGYTAGISIKERCNE